MDEFSRIVAATRSDTDGSVFSSDLTTTMTKLTGHMQDIFFTFDAMSPPISKQAKEKEPPVVR